MKNRIKSILIFILLILPAFLFSEVFLWEKVDKITLELPDDWERDNELDTFLNEILKFRHKTYRNFTITLTYQKLINRDSSRNYAHFDARLLKQKDYVILERSSREINNIPAYEYVYRYYAPLHGSFERDFFTLRKIYIVIGRKYYSFAFTCPSVYYGEYQKYLNRILENFLIELKTDENANLR